MSQKSRRGRKKKFPNLVRTSLWLEKETFNYLNEVAVLTRKVTSKESVTYSDVARKLLKNRTPELLEELKNLLKKKEQLEVQAEKELDNSFVELASFVEDPAAMVSEEVRQQAMDDFFKPKD